MISGQILRENLLQNRESTCQTVPTTKMSSISYQSLNIMDPPNPKSTNIQAPQTRHVVQDTEAGYGVSFPSSNTCNEDNIADIDQRPSSRLSPTPTLRNHATRRAALTLRKSSRTFSPIRAISRAQALPKRALKTRGSGSGQAEVDHLLGLLDQHIPLCKYEWEFILAEHNKLFSLHNSSLIV